MSTLGNKPLETLGAGDIYAAARFLQVLCAGDDVDYEDLLSIADLADDRKTRILAELVRIGAITKVDDKWTPTARGQKINQSFRDRHL